MANKKYKQIFFNELTMSPLCKDDTEIYQRVSNYAKTFQQAQNQLGAKVIRYPHDLSKIILSSDTDLLTYCKNHRRDPKIIAILSSYSMPLEDYTDDENLTVFHQIKASLTINSTIFDSRGLAAAYSYNAPSIGFISEDYWRTVMHDITIDNLSNICLDEAAWPCLTMPEHFEEKDFQIWLSAREELELISTEITYEEKIKHIEERIRDDHGKDVLINHAKSLCHNQYVIEILTSLSFQPKFSDYIYKIHPDGLIDIVLHRDDRGLSMRIKTTGRTIQETTKIAAILKDKYNR